MKNNLPIKIAVDGYSSSGKGVLCKYLSKKYNIFHFESGTLFRSLALLIFEQNIDISDMSYILKLSKDLNQLSNIDSNKIYIPEVTEISSKIATNLEIRQNLFSNIREIINNNKRIIIDGRDVGTNIMKDADFKLFLIADLNIRTLRRLGQYEILGIETSYDKVENELKQRDLRDASRKDFPLIPTNESIIIDTSKMTLNQMFEHVENIIFD